MTKFYTQTGDDGYTSLLGAGRSPKYDPRLETIGAIDEANASIGFARSLCKSTESLSILLTTQRDLYHLMTEIAVLPENSSRFKKFSSERVNWLEHQIDEISKNVSIPKEFIVPGNSQAGAAMDIARTIVRRAERNLAGLLHQHIIENIELLRYMNRLSSLCFIIELMEDQFSGQEQPTFAKQ